MRQIKWQQAKAEGVKGKEGVALSSPGIKSQWTLSDLWHNKHISFLGGGVAALLSVECYTDTLWFLSLHTDTTVSYPVWSTFWFRDESHRGTLKCTAPTLCPVDPELIMTAGTAHPPNTPSTPTPLRWHRHNVLDPGWVWIIGVRGGVYRRCCICHDASAVVLFMRFLGERLPCGAWVQ